MSPPTFTILPVTPKDAHDIVEIAMLAFADDGLGKRFILPNSSVDAVNVLREYRLSRTTHHLAHPKPNELFVKAVSSTDPGQKPLGFAIWVFKSPESSNGLPEQPSSQPSAEGETRTETQVPAAIDQEFKKHAEEVVEKGYQANVGSRRVWHITSLAVHPQSSGLGIGRLLVQVGTQRADADSVEAYVEGTGVALGLYRRCGFVQVEEDGGKGQACLDFGGGILRWCMLRLPTSAT